MKAVCNRRACPFMSSLRDSAPIAMRTRDSLRSSRAIFGTESVMAHPPAVCAKYCGDRASSLLCRAPRWRGPIPVPPMYAPRVGA